MHGEFVSGRTATRHRSKLRRKVRVDRSGVIMRSSPARVKLKPLGFFDRIFWLRDAPTSAQADSDDPHGLCPSHGRRGRWPD